MNKILIVLFALIAAAAAQGNYTNCWQVTDPMPWDDLECLWDAYLYGECGTTHYSSPYEGCRLMVVPCDWTCWVDCLDCILCLFDYGCCFFGATQYNMEHCIRVCEEYSPSC